MSREIKFRVTVLDTIVGYELCSRGSWKHKEVDGAWRFGTFGGKDYKRWQFTGLLDKNGKEIYEGDIIKCRQLTFFPTEVMFVDGGFLLVGKHFEEDGFVSCGIYLAKQTPVEVIGNIWENPELLKTSKGADHANHES